MVFLLMLYVDVGVLSMFSIFVIFLLIVKLNILFLREILLFCSGGWDLLIFGVWDIENFILFLMISMVFFFVLFVIVIDLLVLFIIL